MRVIAAFLGGAVCCVATTASADCLFGAVQEDLRPLGQQIVAESLNMELAEFQLFPGRVDVVRVDLDQDGVAELCIHANTLATCSNGVVVCRYLIWSVTEQRVIFSAGAHRVGFGGWNGPSWQSLRAETAYPDGYVYAVQYDFDDGSYRQTCREVIGRWAGSETQLPRNILAGQEC